MTDNKDPRWIEGEAPDKTEPNLNEDPERRVGEPITTAPIWVEPPADNDEKPRLYGPPEPSKEPLTVYDLVYGILFDPVNTYKRVAEKPPLKLTLILILGLNLLLALMSALFMQQSPLPQDFNFGQMAGGAQQVIDALAPVMAMGGFFLNILLWFFYASLLHLIAEFFGGRGRAVTSFTVYGLAGLPAVLMLPIQGLEILAPQSVVVSTIAALAAIGIYVWGIVLLTIGLREAHKFTTARAFAVVATPWAAGIVFFIVAMIVMAGFMTTFITQLNI